MGKRTGRSTGLSKSRVMAGLQCPKRLYLQVNSPSLGESVSTVQQARFDEGSEIGRLARTHFPGGTLVEADHTASADALAATQKLVENGAKVIFEAAFAHDGVLVRIDVLTRASASAPWNIIEVKSSTSVKDEHVSDVAIQAWVLRACGEKLRRCSVMFINNQCAFPNLDDLFSTEDMTKEVEAAIPSVPKLVAKLQATLKKTNAPTLDIGPHCSDPYECPFTEHCWDERGVVSPSIFELPGIGKKAWDYYQKGIISLTDKRLTGLKGKQARALDVVRAKAIWIDRPAIMNGVKDWKWPLYFLDFETIGSAIPRYEGVRPYQQVPFQFSCHVQDAPGGAVRHIEYLHDQPTDPRPAVAAALARAIGPKGSIAAYNMSVEARAVEHLASVCPKQAATLKKMGDRFVDPLPIVRGSVYAPEFRGSFSIKAVAPALLGEEFAYGGLEVGEGQEAQVAFDQLISALTPTAEKDKLRAAMLAYCGQDTLAMVRLVDWLFKQVSE